MKHVAGIVRRSPAAVSSTKPMRWLMKRVAGGNVGELFDVSSTKPMRWLMKLRAFKHLPILRFLHLLREPFAQEVAAS